MGRAGKEQDVTADRPWPRAVDPFRPFLSQTTRPWQLMSRDAVCSPVLPEQPVQGIVTKDTVKDLCYYGYRPMDPGCRDIL